MGFIEDSSQEEERAELIQNDTETNNKIKLFQKIYQQITGKSESISFASQDDLVIDFDELRQINNKINQVYSTYNDITVSDTHITIFHYKDKKEEFNSFERFKLYNQSTPCPTLTIVMEYNFAFVDKKANFIQKYKIFIKLNSKISILRQLKNEVPFFMQGQTFRFIYGNAAEVKIEYADYVVARTFMSTLQECIEGCKRGNDYSKTILNLQKKSHFFAPFFSFLNGIVITLFFIIETKQYFNNSNLNIYYLKYGVIFFTSFMLTSKASYFLGKLLESYIDRYTPLSYLKINRGDEIIIEKHKKERNKNLFKIAFSILSTIAFEVAVSNISNIISSIL